MLVVVLVVAGVAGGVWWRVWVEDPLEAQLAELASDPAAALDYLAPIDDAEQADTDDDTSKEDGDLWVPSDEAHQHWDQLADRRWGTKGITALTQALAAASSLRNTDTSTDDNRRATWATAQGVILLANHTGQLTDQAKANVGVVLGNCPTELMALAQRVHITATGPDGYYTTTPLTTGGTDQQAITTATAHLMYEVADSTEAAYEISRSATAYTAARASQYMNTHGASTDTLADFYARNADALNLLALLGNTTDAVNAGTAASTDLLTITTNTNGQHTITHTPTTTPQPNPTITTDTPGLLTPAYTNAFNAGLINNPPDPNTTTWYTVDTNGGHHITLKTNEQQRNFYTWVTDGSGNSLGVKDVMNRIGINGNSERWRTTDEFKEYYGGDEW
ncbi:type I secretion C-terminal target domain (VC_A0849 subclass) [Actinomyces ruminicola]|uniref:Type I secretion C-terminal target domain (VC_A0849 subclass) n=1 Tax=Actinomyces ruminicola TaxID=332524 RepID=A0A1G9V1L1_9ACTO|nr:type I secretion C-terminal target domain (VC_A0849 subclass) [Actinomyces ruminicola]